MSRAILTFLTILVVAACPALAQKLELVAGGGAGGSGSKATEVKLGQVFGFDQDAAGNSYIIEYTNKFWKIDPKGAAHLIGGDGEKGDRGDGGPAADARFNVPHALAVHRPTGDVYIADTGNNKVRRYDAKTGTISTFAGTGIKGLAGNGGPAKEATFGGIYCIAFDPGFTRLIITDLDHKQIRTVETKTGIVSLIAGDGKKGTPADGVEAKSASLTDPRAACADAAGNVYILERGGHSLRVVDASGKLRTIAGTGKAGNSGDGGPAKMATLSGPKHLCMHGENAILIADTENHVVREIDLKTGVISRIAGVGKRGVGAPGNDALQTAFSQPHGVYVAPDGNVYLCDTMNGRVFRVVK